MGRYKFVLRSQYDCNSGERRKTEPHTTVGNSSYVHAGSTSFEIFRCVNRSSGGPVVEASVVMQSRYPIPPLAGSSISPSTDSSTLY